jgi:hypothetical protein
MAGTVLLHQRSFAGEFVEPAFAELAELVQAHGLDLRTGSSHRAYFAALTRLFDVMRDVENNR